MLLRSKYVHWLFGSLAFVLCSSAITIAQPFDGEFNQAEYVILRPSFEASLDARLNNNDVGNGPSIANIVIRDWDNASQPASFDAVKYRTTVEAGSATGTPADSPTARIDPNSAAGLYPGVGSLEIVHPTLGNFTCSGSVIDDQYVLTAAHCFDVNNDGAVDAGIATNTMFHLNDMPTMAGTPSSSHGVSTVTIHPSFGGFSTAGANDDLAVVKLSSTVPASATKYAIRGSDMSTGEVLDVVGYGVSGFGDVAGVEVLPDFTIKRSGSNAADVFVVDDEGSGVNEIFLYDFDGPAGPGVFGGATLGNDVETMVRGGDSGGPAFVNVAGKPVIAGVNTFEFELMGTTPPVGVFGSLGGGIILNAEYSSWISSVSSGTVVGFAPVIPEPSSYALLLSAGLLWVLGRWRSAQS